MCAVDSVVVDSPTARAVDGRYCQQICRLRGAHARSACALRFAPPCLVNALPIECRSRAQSFSRLIALDDVERERARKKPGSASNVVSSRSAARRQRSSVAALLGASDRRSHDHDARRRVSASESKRDRACVSIFSKRMCAQLRAAASQAFVRQCKRCPPLATSRAVVAELALLVRVSRAQSSARGPDCGRPPIRSALNDVSSSAIDFDTRRLEKWSNCSRTRHTALCEMRRIQS